VTSKQYEIESLIVTNRKSHTGIRLVATSVTLNDFERRNSSISRYFTECDSFGGLFYVMVVEDRPIMSAKYHLPLIFGQTCPEQQSHGVFATAKLLVLFCF